MFGVRGVCVDSREFSDNQENQITRKVQSEGHRLGREGKGKKKVTGKKKETIASKRNKQVGHRHKGQLGK